MTTRYTQLPASSLWNLLLQHRSQGHKLHTRTSPRILKSICNPAVRVQREQAV